MQLIRKKVSCLFLFYWAQNVFNPDSMLCSVLLGIFTYFVRSSYMWFLFCNSSCFEFVSTKRLFFYQFSPYNSIPLKLKRKDCSSGFYATKVWMSRDHISWHVDLQSCTARSSLLWREETRWRRLKTVFLWAREKEHTYQTHILLVLVSKLRPLRSCFILRGCFNMRIIERTNAPNVNFRKISVRKTIWDPEFSEHLL